MSGVHETGRIDLPEKTKPLSEKQLVSRLAILHADLQLFRKLGSYGPLTDEEKHQRRQVSVELAGVAALTLPRIVSGELETIGVEPIADDDRVLQITIFGGAHKIPVSIKRVEERIPQLRNMLSGR